MALRVLSTFVVLPLALATLCAASSKNTTCTGQAAGTDWWKNPERRNPCEVLQSLMQECDAKFKLPMLQLGDKCHSKTSSGLDNHLAPCCCSTEAYNLQQACWSCQHGGDDPMNKRPTLREFISCPKALDDAQDVYQEICLPGWANFGIPLDTAWSLDFTRTSWIEKLNFVRSALGGDGDGDGDGNDDDHEHTKTATIASIVGSLTGLSLVAVLLAIAIVVRRRRRREQRRITRDSRSSGGQAMPAWFTRNPEYQSSTSDSRTYVDPIYAESEKVPLAPPPSLGRGRFAASVAPSRTDSWWSSLAREPYVPRARNTLEPHDYANRSVVSMIRSEAASSRESLESERTIESFSNSRRPPTMRSTATHAFSV